MLSDDQVRFYEEEGYLVVENALEPALLEKLQAVTDAFIERSRALTESDDVFDLGEGHSAATPRLNRIKQPVAQDPAFWEAIRSPRMIEILTPILGPSIRLQNSKLNTKGPGGGAAVEWHQDWAFYPHTNDDLLAVGMLLDDVAEENGPLMVVPGSHRRPVLDHHHDGVFCGAIDPRDPLFEKDEAVSLTGRAGTITLHHARTLHGSAPNHSDRARLLLLYECVAADAWPLTGASSLFNGKNPAEVWEIMTGRMVVGEQTPVPRFAAVPARLPLPPAPDSTSIFRIQKSARAVSAFGEAA